jgi:alpha-mannosidase
MLKPTLHLICNAHLDPVWQWRWEEGCSEALSTFGNAVEILHQHPSLIFNHNEAVLYRWIKEYEPKLFKEIQKLVRKRRWCISGGWYLQPDVNMPGTESLIRQIAEGRRYFKRYFGVVPTVAYNFDSFGHSGGLPQILKQSGYRMYIHMRPQEQELKLPSDLYRWRGVDGSEIFTYRISVGLYHTERDNIEQRLKEGTELALKLNRDVPVFWGIGNHGGGATREDLKIVDEYVKKENRVKIIHSSTERLYESLKRFGKSVPIVEGDLQRVFTGCYTSLSRIKRRAQRELGELVQSEALRASSLFTFGQTYPSEELENAWRDYLFNDFHDILPGSCTEPAEQDALELYGRASQSVRRLVLGAASVFNSGKKKRVYIPVTVLNTNPSCTKVPIEVECMLNLRPKWTGQWHLSAFTLDGKEIPSQQEQPESLLPFNGWRRKVCFIAELPQVGASHYYLDIFEGDDKTHSVSPKLKHIVNQKNGLVTSLDAGEGRECLAGAILQPLIVDDDGDSWGADRWSYRSVVGRFETMQESVSVIEQGPIRTITEAVLTCSKSSIVLHTISYGEFPVIEYHLRIHWNETRKRLKLAFPTVFRESNAVCEVPGGVITRPADGEEHVQGRWLMVGGIVEGKNTAIGIITSGQHGFDLKDGEVRISVLRSAAYCHEQGFAIGEKPMRKYMDQGVHEVRLLVTAGDTAKVRKEISGLADWLNSPPVVYSHLPLNDAERTEVLRLEPQSVRLLAMKRSYDGKALIVRVQEMAGVKTRARVTVTSKVWATSKVAVTSVRPFKIFISLKPLEIQTIRIEKNGKWKLVNMIDEV